MKTISAKELRDNLDRIVKRARAGETIKVTYRSRPAFTIIPEPKSNTGPEPGSPEAVQLFLERVKGHKRTTAKPALDPSKSIKDLYREMLDNDPKYK